ncbi:MAG: hypothetical protein V2J55_11735 [Candidatus Competibacteraceae bacterium]|jgi:hypothetical protein|nr:hypothetical protein [Candidatus Competibacteraceae bacterium]
MSDLDIRIAEDTNRPLGQAIITLQGLSGRLETLEFSLSRRGYAVNHLGADGWQGTECWLPPEEAWYNGEALQFVLGSDLVYQLENMPYELALRGEGLAETVRTTVIWPLELEVEETAGGQHEPVGGTRIHPQPLQRASEPSNTPESPQVSPVNPEPLEQKIPVLNSADITIPDIGISDYQLSPREPAQPPPIPVSAPVPDTSIQEPPPLPVSSVVEQPPAVEQPPPLPITATPSAAEESVTPGQERVPESPPAEPLAIDTTPPKSKGLIIGIAAVLGLLLIGGAVGWWWLNTKNQSSGEFALPSSETPTPAPPESADSPVTETAQPATDSTSPASPTAESPPVAEPETSSKAVPEPVSAEQAVNTEPPAVEAEPVVVTEPSPTSTAEPEPETPTVTSKPAPARAVTAPTESASQPAQPAEINPEKASGADLAAELEKQLQGKSELEADLESQLKQP